MAIGTSAIGTFAIGASGGSAQAAEQSGGVLVYADRLMNVSAEKRQITVAHEERERTVKEEGRVFSVV